MKRELTIITLILTIYLTSCGQTENKNRNQQNQINALTMDTSIIAILSSDIAPHWIFKDPEPADLTTEDLQKIEIILLECINNYNTEQEKKIEEYKNKYPEHRLNNKNFNIDLARYKRQYIAVINSKGEKEVWVNCFCNTLGTDWRKNLIIVLDGGNCYFNLKINLTKGEYFDLIINGGS